MINALRHAQKMGDAIMLTEFGSAEPFALKMGVDLADKYALPWFNWAYCGCDDPTTALQPASKQGFVLEPKQAPVLANVDMDKLKALVRPYPQAIAGTPERWSFDASSGKFELNYRVESPPGLARASSALTTVHVPNLQYPYGYDVKVTSGQVVSGMGSTSLSIRADAGAKDVTVAITRR